jgi:hypothetical protein
MLPPVLRPVHPARTARHYLIKIMEIQEFVSEGVRK